MYDLTGWMTQSPKPFMKPSKTSFVHGQCIELSKHIWTALLATPCLFVLIKASALSLSPLSLSLSPCRCLYVTLSGLFCPKMVKGEKKSLLCPGPASLQEGGSTREATGDQAQKFAVSQKNSPKSNLMLNVFCAHKVGPTCLLLHLIMLSKRTHTHTKRYMMEMPAEAQTFFSFAFGKQQDTFHVRHSFLSINFSFAMNNYKTFQIANNNFLKVENTFLFAFSS